jgi:hypothetical protein
MILISHRGNIILKDKERENSPLYIQQAISQKYDVEVDLFIINKSLYLGHDKPEYLITLNWLQQFNDKLWIHCKNIEAVEFLQKTDMHYFWHENDTVTLTSKGIIWAYPGKQPIKNSIAVLPELYNDSVKNCLGVCSDNIQAYKN